MNLEDDKFTSNIFNGNDLVEDTYSMISYIKKRQNKIDSFDTYFAFLVVLHYKISSWEFIEKKSHSDLWNLILD